MRHLKWVILAVGSAVFAYLLRQMGLEHVTGAIGAVGAGFVLVFGQEIVPIALNTLGWRLTFRPEHSKSVSFARLLHLRIVGDGLNYLTPTAGLGGELARVAMLGEDLPIAARIVSVSLAKLTQGIGMALTALMVVLFVAQGRLKLASFSGHLTTGVILLGALLGLILILQMRAGKDAAEGDVPEDQRSLKKAVVAELKRIDKSIGAFLRDHPGRFAASVLCYWAAFVWGMVEVYLITWLMGVPLTWSTALAIETLSVLFDGLFIMVPGKIGTQEATRTAIFAGLGMSPHTGFAYGIVRHLREIAWALVGLAWFSLFDKDRHSKAPSAANPASSGVSGAKKRANTVVKA